MNDRAWSAVGVIGLLAAVLWPRSSRAQSRPRDTDGVQMTRAETENALAGRDGPTEFAHVLNQLVEPILGRAAMQLGTGDGMQTRDWVLGLAALETGWGGNARRGPRRWTLFGVLGTGDAGTSEVGERVALYTTPEKAVRAWLTLMQSRRYAEAWEARDMRAIARQYNPRADFFAEWEAVAASVRRRLGD